jgi:hypothetical protein
MGFNGARKHQKVEDPRWLYWADRLGFLVWEEMANAQQYSPVSAQRLLTEWQAVVTRDRNHPCIITWAPINESWGIRTTPDAEPEVDLLRRLYRLTRSLDRTRLVVSNDGWEHARSDLCTIHDYADPDHLRERYASASSSVRPLPDGRRIYCEGYKYQGEPILVTEFGGIAFSDSQPASWGYSAVSNETEFHDRYRDLIEALTHRRVICGFCYTQLTDVEQEINGLLRADRTSKVALSKIRVLTQVGQ